MSAYGASASGETGKVKLGRYEVVRELGKGAMGIVYLAKDRDHGEDDPNSGSNTLYLTPGFRVRFNPTASLTLAPSFPVIEHVNGNQGKVEFKMAVTFSLSF